MVEARIEALKHGGAWLTMAWTAHGRAELIAEASKDCGMLVAFAVAALSYAGAKANYGNALKIASHNPGLRRMVIDRPDDEAPWQAYAAWLLAQAYPFARTLGASVMSTVGDLPGVIETLTRVERTHLVILLRIP